MDKRQFIYEMQTDLDTFYDYLANKRQDLKEIDLFEGYKEFKEETKRLKALQKRIY